MPSLFLNKHFKIIIHNSFACVCVFEALFIHRYIEKPSEFKVMVGGGDNCAILDFSQRHLTGHSWTYLRDFQKRRIFFFEKLPPCTAKTVFSEPKKNSAFLEVSQGW